MEKEHLRINEAAAFLGVDKQTIYAWARKGRISRGFKLSARCTVWPREELEKFVERRKAESANAVQTLG